MQSSYYSLLKPNISSISMESTRTREPISNNITLSSDNNNSSSQNRNNTSQQTMNCFQDLSNAINNTATNNVTNISTQQILIDEGTIDCLSLPSKTTPSHNVLSSCPKSFKNLNVYNNNNKSLQMDEDEDDEDEVDQLRIDEGTEAITPTIITNKNSLYSNTSCSNTNETKMLLNNNNQSSSILDTLISSTNGPSCSMSSTITTSNTINGPAITSSGVTSSSPSSVLMNNNLPHNFPFLSSTIASSPSKGGFLDRLFTFSPNATSGGVMSHLVTPLKTPNSSYQDRVSLFTTASPHKVDMLSSPNDSNHSNPFSSNLTNNSILSNDESPNFSNIWLNQQQGKQSSNSNAATVLGSNTNTTTANVILTTNNVHNNIINRQQTAQMANNSGLMDTLYSNQIHSSPPSQRTLTPVHSGIQKHTINQKELRRAQEKTKNNLKHFLNESTLINTNGKIVSPLTTSLSHKAQLTSPTNSITSPTTSSEESEFPLTTNIKLPSPESEVPLKQKLKMRSYKIL